MKIISRVLAIIALGAMFQHCKKDGFPVPPASTVPKFTYTLDNKGYAPSKATFTSESIVPGNVGDAYYKWDFGDGSISTEANPTHTFTAPGAYSVKLTIKTTVSLEIKTASLDIPILSNEISGKAVYFTDGSTVYSGYLNNDAPVFSALPIGPFEDSYGMAIDTIHSKLYISDSGKGSIYRYDLESKDLVEFRTGLDGPDGLAIDLKNNKLYWDTGSSIQRTSLSSTTTTDIEDFVTGQANDPEGVSVDTANNKLYWVNYDGGLWSINLDGSGKTELIADAQGGSTLVVGNRVYFDYWVASGDIHLKSASLDGTNMSTLTSGIPKVVFGLGYESKSNKIYWGNRKDGKIMRANLDGSGIETWYSKDGSNPRGIVFGKKK